MARTDRPWHERIVGASDKVRYSLVGRGVLQFLIEVRDEMRCPYTWNPQANFVAVHGRRFGLLRTLIFKFTVSIIIGDLNDDLRDVELPLTYCVAGSGGL